MATLQDVLNRLGTVDRQYQNFWVAPMANAYTDAHSKVAETVQGQADRNKMIAELMLTVITIGAGVGLGALFAQTSARAVMGAAAINFASRRNLVRTMAVFSAISTSQPLKFLVTESYTKAASALTNSTKTALGELSAANSEILTSLENPQVFQNLLESYVDTALIAIGLVANDLSVSDELSATEKDTIADEMMNSPIIQNAPVRRVIAGRTETAELMELAIYMVMVMNSDYFEVWEYAVGGGWGSSNRLSREAIPVPTTHTDYPQTYDRGRTSRDSRGTPLSRSGRAGHLKYEQVGRAIRRRIDTLARQHYDGKPFFIQQLDADEVERAERIYAEIVNRRIPMI